MSQENEMDWASVRSERWAKAPPPPEWDAGVKPISLAGLSLFGIHQQSGNLYWDGKEIVVRRRFALTWYQGLLATITAFSTLVLASVEFYRLITTG
jgi:hypothetical protein